MEEKKTAIHLDPVWRDRANFLIAARFLLNEQDPTSWREEQLWARQTGINRFEICCIPFFVRGLALGDEVETGLDGSERYIIQRVIHPSGHTTFRIWFGNSPYQHVKNEVVRELSDLGCLLEWSSENLLAVSAPSRQTAEDVARLLLYRQQRGHLLYETGRSIGE